MQLSYFSYQFLDIARSKFLLSVLRKVICFYSLGAFPRRFHSSISVRLVATSHNFVLFSPCSKKLSLSLARSLFKIRTFNSVRVSTLHAFPLLSFYPRIYILNLTCGHTSAFNSYFSDDKSDLRVGS